MKLRGIGEHFALTLRLNFRSKQALVYGYFVPLFFLVAFGTVFRGETPLLWSEMGQLLTLTILGGACFGLPTALVAERERGVWKRYRILPVGIGNLVGSTVAARTVIVYSAVLGQVGLARLIYGTPLPLHPLALAFSLGLVITAFTGLGWLIAALASDVPAVQALGQCLFLPMVMIGGVGVPLAALPSWAQRGAAFMPGRYAVEILQRAYTEEKSFSGSGFAILAILTIGTAAAICGAKLFRWEAGRKLGSSAWVWIGVAFLAWGLVGTVAVKTRHVDPILPGVSYYAAITDRQIDQITYDDLTGDNELVTRLAPPFPNQERSGRLADIQVKLQTWPPGKTSDLGQRVRNFLSIAAIADIGPDLLEAEIGREIFDYLVATTDPKALRQALAWAALSPEEGNVITHAPEFGLRRTPNETIVRERSAYYAKKYLGRLLGKIQEPVRH